MDSDDQPRLELGPGNTILAGKYRVERKLKTGGMGEVWLLTHLALNTKHVLKVILAEHAQSEEARARFSREAWATAQFSSHPNAVTIHDYGTAGGAVYMIMEYIPGQDLRALLQPGKPMPLDWTSRVLSQLCDVLQVAHDNDPPIVHRDLKPENLMLVGGRPEGQEHLKVLDFGIAKILDATGSTPGQTLRTKSLLGTPGYMSPEQIQLGLSQEDGDTGPNRDIKLDGRSDIYAVGVILYELLTGRRPFESSDVFAILSQHLHSPPPRFSERNAQVNVPRPLEKLVLRCLAKKPDKRPGTARELAEEFRRAAAEAPPRGPSNGPGPGSKPRVKALVIGSAVVAVAAIGLVLGLPRSSTNDPPGKATSGKSQTTGPGEPTNQAKPGPVTPPSSSIVPKPTPSATLLAEGGSTTKDQRPIRIVSAPPRDIVESILNDVRTLPAATRPYVRYLSFAPPASGASNDVAAISGHREELVKTLAQHGRKSRPIHLREFEPSRTLASLDIRDLGWDERPFQVIRGEKPVGPSPLNLYDLILLEYPFATTDAASSTFQQLVKDYLAPAALVRPIASVRADWLAQAVTRAPLASDLKGQTLEDRPRILEKVEAPGQRWLGTSGPGESIVPIDALSYAEIRPDAAAIDVELKTNHPDNVFVPGDRMVITVTNLAAEPVFIELIGTDSKGRQTILTSAPARVAPGKEYRYPAEGQGIEIGDEPGRELLTVMASSTAFPSGILLRGEGVADRVIHASDPLTLERIRVASPTSSSPTMKKTIVTKTRTVRPGV